MKVANYSPIYAAALYPGLAEICRSHGYALACHGSLARDFDLVCIPWTDEPSEPDDVVKEICSKYWIRLLDGIEQKPHGRLAYFISVGHGECGIDLSFMPRIKK